MLNWFWRAAVRGYPFRRGGNRLLAMGMRRVRGPYVLARDALGSTLLLDLRNFVDSYIYVAGLYERSNAAAFLEAIGRHGADLFLDIGANIGMYTVNVARLPGIGEVHAFEPDTRNHAQLHANVFLNGLYDRVRVHRVALSDQGGEREFYPSRSAERGDEGLMNTGASSLEYDGAHHAGQPTLRVATARLDDYLPLRGRRLAVKIDVEGHELSVLAGMRRTLRDNEAILLVEAVGERGAAVDAAMAECGYAARAAATDPHYRLYGRRA